MRVALYIRVSTQEQAEEGFSIAAQKEKLTAYAVSQDWDIVGYYLDEGRSAKDTDRPELQRLMNDITQRKIDVVLVYKLDRLTRSVLDLYKLLDHFEKYDCKFKSATEVYDTTTAIGRLFITLVAALAQWERENLAERVRMGMEQRTKEGKWKGGTAPFGYEYKDGVLTICEEEARIVRKIFEIYLGGNGDNKTAIILNNMGYTSRFGSAWNGRNVAYILQNPFYVGKLRWNYKKNQQHYFTVETDAIPPILDEVTFQKVQRIRDVRSTKHPKQATSPYIFAGLLRCSRCGSILVSHANTRKGHRYSSYRCAKKVKGLCDLPMINEKKFENEFLLRLSAFSFSEAAAATESIDGEDYTDDIQTIEREIEKIKKRRKKWQLAWADDQITDEEFQERMEEDRQKEQELTKQLQGYEHMQMDIAEPEEIIKAIQQIKEQWEYATLQEKKTVAQMLVEDIIIDIHTSKGGNIVEIKNMSFK